ncbi:SDR family NAD(P)-dependent oxidoreductase [Methylocystis sp. IM3]|uniref:SDR family NAD(P)-dependent oxidoreductase n=1 Tax=unclassified Methylocystis TaxID=2625913 RepID=UPI0030F4CDB0
MEPRPLAVVTGASTGIGIEFAKLCATRGYDLVIAADEPEIAQAAEAIRSEDARVWEIETDLSTMAGVAALYDLLRRLARPVDILIANAGRGLGGDFLDQDFSQIRRVIDTNITGTVYLTQLIGRDMRSRGSGGILLVGSIAGFITGSFQAVYHGTKAFIYNYSTALADELQGTGVTVTCLMPGATETEFFRRAGMLDTEAGRARKADPAEVARDGFEALMEGRREIVSGWQNKLLALVSHVTPASILAWRNRQFSAPDKRM